MATAMPFRPSPSSDRPVLLPTQVQHGMMGSDRQRKLRHVRGVLCRNISLRPPARPRSSTQDDDELQTSWQSPSKLRGRLQANGPHTSMSSSDLKEMVKRPMKTPRRRSSRVHQLGALEDSVYRQKRWEKVIETRLVDVFFTVHANRKGIAREYGLHR